ncbi:MAG: DUF1572 family protein [Chitinophagaceae bacterium]|nr:DUF1572 family protein [Chitinophagaceae bacterium]MCA6446619.1 DUF1572 family protein [Chitinophagaceae bacterium]
MMIETLKILFKRDLERVKEEINLFETETNIWKVDGDVKNSAGNLCLHLVGNLNAYIGIGLAKTGYVRKRELEFSSKDISKAELIHKIDETLKVVLAGLDNLTESQMKENFPLVVWDKPTEMEYTLVRLISHLNYHLGQINYHRRLIDSSKK